MDEESPININQMDNLSIEMENCLKDANYRDLDQDFGIFDQLYEDRITQVVFYSQTDLVEHEFNNDYQCYFNT